METLEELFSLGADSLAARYVLFVVLLILISCQLYAYIIDMSRYPKGPISLPLIGNVLNLFWHGDMLDFLMSSWRRYGDIFSIKIGSKMFVVLNGYETINEALVKRAEAFSEHNDFHNLSGAGPEKTGILFSPYPVWKKHRKLVLTVFKDMGYVRQGLQEKVNQEIAKVIPEMEFIKKPFVIEEILQRAVSNVISNVVFGCRFEYDDEEFRTLLDINKKLIMRGRTIAIVSLFPLLLHLPFDIFKVKDTLNIAARLEEIMLKKITEHEKASDQVQTSFIDAYLGEISKDEESKTGYFTKQRCVSAICDLFGAGSETTSTALDWAFLHCILFPELQERVHNEIDHVLGQRPAMLADRQKMPFVNAFLTEVLRFGNVVPLAIPHRVIRDVSMNGSLIPKDTEIIVNLHSVLHDQRIYEEPWVFRPSRFLDSGGHFLQPDKFMPFSTGRRACLGEELAQIELFLFFVATMQRFTLRPEPGANISANGMLGITRRPQPYRVLATPRSDSLNSYRLTAGQLTD